mgnify:CR=1 FL=1
MRTAGLASALLFSADCLFLLHEQILIFMEKDYEREMQGCLYGPPPIDFDEPILKPNRDIVSEASSFDNGNHSKESNRSKRMFILTVLCFLLFFAVVIYLFVIF